MAAISLYLASFAPVSGTGESAHAVVPLKDFARHDEFREFLDKHIGPNAPAKTAEAAQTQ